MTRYIHRRSLHYILINTWVKFFSSIDLVDRLCDTHFAKSYYMFSVRR